MIITCGTCGAPRSTYGGFAHDCSDPSDPRDVAIVELGGQLLEAQQKIEQLEQCMGAVLLALDKAGIRVETD